MRAPLVILAVFAIGVGVIDLPWAHTITLANWLAPVFGSNLFHPAQSTSQLWVLSIVDGAVAVVAVGVAWWLWRSAVDRPELEPSFLQRVWYWDDFYDYTIGRPSQQLARFCAVVIDNRVIDGAVNGLGSLVRRTGDGARRVQTGFVRNYLLGIVLGLVAILAFMASRTWWS
jgi:NADH-quinone oxidoreductase subunit L